MSIEIDGKAVAFAIERVECANKKIEEAMGLLNAAAATLAQEIKFGNDPATEQGRMLETFFMRLDAQVGKIVWTHTLAPDCAAARRALNGLLNQRRIAAQPESMRPTGAAAINLARSVA